MIIGVENEILSSGKWEQFDYGVNAEDMNHLFMVLRSSLYSDKMLAILREYGSNAYEAHQEAGISDRPISVHLPTPLVPSLRIRDFGRGLSQEEVRTVYTRFGRSTKRASNEFMGCLGFGSKAGFAYGSSFGVCSYHEGTCTVYEAYLNEKNESCMVVVEERPTDESGLEVIIPIRDVDRRALEEKALAFYAPWTPYPDISGGVLSRSLHEPVLTGKGWGIYPRWPARVRMGQITYPINASQFPRELQSLLSEALLIDAPIGTVTHTPSRESLEYGPKTLEYLNRRLAELTEELKEECESRLGSCKTRWEALTLIKKLSVGSGNGLEAIRNKAQWNGLSAGRFMTKEEHESIQALGGEFSSFETRPWKDTVAYAGYAENRQILLDSVCIIPKRLGHLGARLRVGVGSGKSGSLLHLPRDERRQQILDMPLFSGFPWVDLETIQLPGSYNSSTSLVREKGTILKYVGEGSPPWIPCEVPESPGVYVPVNGTTLKQDALEYLKSGGRDGSWLRENWGTVKTLIPTLYGIAPTRVPPGWVSLDEGLRNAMTSQFLLKDPDNCWDWETYEKVLPVYRELLSNIEKVPHGPLRGFLDRVATAHKYSPFYVAFMKLQIRPDVKDALLPGQEHEASIQSLYPGFQSLSRSYYGHRPNLGSEEFVRFVEFSQAAHEKLGLLEEDWTAEKEELEGTEWNNELEETP